MHPLLGWSDFQPAHLGSVFLIMRSKPCEITSPTSVYLSLALFLATGSGPKIETEAKCDVCLHFA